MVVAAALIASLLAGDPRDPHRVVELRWLPVPDASLQQAMVDAGGRQRRLSVVSPTRRLLRLRCPPGVKPRRYILGASSLASGEFSTGQRHDDADDGTWYFPALGRAAWAYEAEGCGFEFRREQLSLRGLLRLEYHGSDPAAEVISRQLLSAPSRAWLSSHQHQPLRYWVVRPVWTWPGTPRALPPDQFQGAERIATLTGSVDGWTSARPHWRIAGPARFDIEARALGGEGSLCLSVAGSTSCRQTERERVLPWRPRMGLATRAIGGRIASRSLVWRVAVGPGLHVVEIEGPAWVRLRYRPLARFASQKAPLVFPDRCAERSCATRMTAGRLRPRAPALSSERVTIWLPLQGHEAQGWAPLGRTDQPLLDDNGILALKFLPGRSGSMPCRVRFAPDEVLVGPGPQTDFYRDGRFAWMGPGEPALPEVEGCIALGRSSGDTSDLHSSLRLPAVFDRLAPQTSVDYVFDAAAETTLRVSLDETTLEVRLDLETPAGKQGLTVLALRAISAAPEDGWQQPVAIPLGRLTALRVRSDSWAAVQARVRTMTQEGSFPTRTPPPRLEDLSRLLTRADNPGRGRLLCQRAELLDALGQGMTARQDRLLAVALGGDECRQSVGAAQDLLRNASARGWIPLDPLWVGANQASPRAMEAAARGDYGTLAELHALAAEQPRPGSGGGIVQLERWRRAIVGGQVLTAPQRLLAFVDRTRLLTPEVDSVRWNVLATLSRWQSVVQMEAAEPTRVTVPQQSSLGEHSDAGLFPEFWPESEILRFATRAALVLPETVRPRDGQMWARCRVASARQLGTPCNLSIVDAEHGVVEQLTLSPWGRAQALALPPTGTLYLVAEPTRGFERQLRVPEDLRRHLDKPVSRRGFLLPGGVAARLYVAGPTVLRLRAARGADDAVVEVKVGGQTVPRSLRPGASEPLLVPVSQSGPVPISLRCSEDVVLTAELRVPRRGSREVPADRRLLRSRATSAPPVLPPPNLEDRRQRFLGGRRDGKPPGTLYARLGAASDSFLEEAVAPWALRSDLRVGLTMRPRKALWYWDAEIGARSRPNERGTFLGRSGADWLLVRQPVDVRVVSDGHVAANGTLLSTRFEGYVHVAAPLGESVQPFARVGGLGQAVWGGAAGPWTSDRLLWSQYRADHLWALALESGARWTPERWSRVTVKALAQSNAPSSSLLAHSPLDYVALGATLDRAWPSFQLRAAPSLEWRFGDGHRAEGYWNPKLSARALITLWPLGVLGWQLRAHFSYRPHFQTATAGLALVGYLSNDRALMDVRPSHIVHRAAAEWWQDASAEADWPF